MGGVVVLLLLLALVGAAIVIRQKKKKASYSITSRPLPDPLVGDNPVYMSSDEDHKFSNPLYEDHSNGNCACGIVCLFVFTRL